MLPAYLQRVLDAQEDVPRAYRPYGARGSADAPIKVSSSSGGPFNAPDGYYINVPSADAQVTFTATNVALNFPREVFYFVWVTPDGVRHQGTQYFDGSLITVGTATISNTDIGVSTSALAGTNKIILSGSDGDFATYTYTIAVGTGALNVSASAPSAPAPAPAPAPAAPAPAPQPPVAPPPADVFPPPAPLPVPQQQHYPAVPGSRPKVPVEINPITAPLQEELTPEEGALPPPPAPNPATVPSQPAPIQAPALTSVPVQQLAPPNAPVLATPPASLLSIVTLPFQPFAHLLQTAFEEAKGVVGLRSVTMPRSWPVNIDRVWYQAAATGGLIPGLPLLNLPIVGQVNPNPNVQSDLRCDPTSPPGPDAQNMLPIMAVGMNVTNLNYSSLVVEVTLKQISLDVPVVGTDNDFVYVDTEVRIPPGASSITIYPHAPNSLVQSPPTLLPGSYEFVLRAFGTIVGGCNFQVVAVPSVPNVPNAPTGVPNLPSLPAAPNLGLSPYSTVIGGPCSTYITPGDPPRGGCKPTVQTGINYARYYDMHVVIKSGRAWSAFYTRNQAGQVKYWPIDPITVSVAGLTIDFGEPVVIVDAYYGMLANWGNPPDAQWLSLSLTPNPTGLIGPLPQLPSTGGGLPGPGNLPVVNPNLPVQVPPPPPPGTPLFGAVLYLDVAWGSIVGVAQQVELGVFNGAGVRNKSSPNQSQPYAYLILHTLPGMIPNPTGDPTIVAKNALTYDTVFATWAQSTQTLLNSLGVHTADIQKTNQPDFVATRC